MYIKYTFNIIIKFIKRQKLKKNKILNFRKNLFSKFYKNIKKR